MSEFFFDLPECRGRLYDTQDGWFTHEVKHANGTKEVWCGTKEYLSITDEDIRRDIPKKKKKAA